METLDFSKAGCALHTIHVPEPQESQMHHVYPKYLQQEVGEIAGGGEKIPVCPTGHINIHHRIAVLLAGKKIRGRGGKTGEYAQKAVDWYREKQRENNRAKSHLPDA